jgi:hypothetical protein
MQLKNYALKQAAAWPGTGRRTLSCSRPRASSAWLDEGRIGGVNSVY